MPRTPCQAKIARCVSTVTSVRFLPTSAFNATVRMHGCAKRICDLTSTTMKARSVAVRLSCQPVISMKAS
ncbi:MAG TPA: hypothetical protein EYG57_13795 [Planctomycetes bacterium]|nr:hypothetical protein [Planctomycetota bacterium]